MGALFFFSPLGVHLTRAGVNFFGKETLYIGSSSGSYWKQFAFTDIKIETKSNVSTLKKVSVRWRPEALFQGTLHLQKVGFDGFALKPRTEVTEDKQGEDSSSSSLAEFFFPLPFAIQLDELLATDIFYDRGVDKKGEPNTSFLFDRVLLSGNAGREGVFLKKLQADGPDMATNLSGHFLLDQEANSKLTGTFRFAGFGFHSMAGDLALSGSFSSPDTTIRLHFPGTLTLTGTLTDLWQSPAWKAELTAENFDLSRWIKHCPRIVLDDVQASMYGDFGHYQGYALFYGKWDHFDKLRLEGELHGTKNFIDFHSLILQREDAVVKAEDSWISWEKLFEWRGDFVAENIDISLLDNTFSGIVDAKFFSKGEVFAEDVEALFSIDELRGVVHDQPVSMKGELVLHENWLSTDNLTIQNGHMDGSAIIGPAKLLWSPEPGWSGKVMLQKFNPAFFHPDFAGEIDGEFFSSGQFATAATPLSLSIDIEQLSGHLREQQLFGSGAIVFANNILATEGFDLQLGESTLHFDKGKVDVENSGDEKLSLTVTFTSPDLNSIIPQSKGSVNFTANVEGTRKHPVIDVSFTGKDFVWQEYMLQAADGNLQLELTKNGRTQGRVEGTGLRRGDISFQQLSLALAGKVDKHQLSVTLQQGEINANPFSITGTFTGGWSFDPQWWQGTLVDSHIDLESYGDWRQENDAYLQLSSTTISLHDFILNSQFGKVSGMISAVVENDNKKRWQADVQVSNIDLEEFEQEFQTPFSMTGEIEGTLELKGEGPVVEQGVLDISLPEAVFDLLTFPLPGEQLLLHSGQLSGEIANGVVQLKGGIKERGGGNIEYLFQLTEFDSFITKKASEQPLWGEITVRDFDVKIVGSFLSYGQPYGTLTSDLSVSGMLTEPQFTGNFSLSGGVGLLSQGILLENPEIILRANGNGMQLNARTESGEGFVQIDGRMGYGILGKFGRVQITGRNFLAVNQPEYSFVVNPDISFQFNEQSGSLTGQIDVVSGIIEPNQFTDILSASDDVIFVEKGEREFFDWLFSMDVQLNLGDNVSIEGFGFDGDIGGNLDVKKEPGELLSGRGILELRSGKFSIYNRSLDITRGNIIFSGGPIDNPGVDVRAEKSMSDHQSLSEGYTVGVDISGLVQDLQFRLFSSPPMSETEILSYMIFGHSLAGTNAGEESILASTAEKLGLEGGALLFGKLGNLLLVDDIHFEGSVDKENVSLVVGKHLTKDIYVGYNVNMYSSLGQFWVRYDLGKGFSVQTFSSAQSSGADLLYSFEK